MHFPILSVLLLLRQSGPLPVGADAAKPHSLFAQAKILTQRSIAMLSDLLLG